MIRKAVVQGEHCRIEITVNSRGEPLTRSEIQSSLFAAVELAMKVIRDVPYVSSPFAKQRVKVR